MLVTEYTGLLRSDWLGILLVENQNVNSVGRYFKTGVCREDNSTQTRKLTTFGKLVAEKRRKSAFLLEEEPHCPRSVNFTYSL